MKRLAIAFVCAAASFACSQVKMKVQIGSKNAGTVVITQKVLKDGSKLVQLAMNLTSPPRTVRTESLYAKDGSPVRKFQETVVIGQRTRHQVTATFSVSGARVVIDINGSRETKEVELKAGAKLANPSEFWFVREKPKVGARVQAHTFNLEQMKWEQVTVTYLGPKEIKIGGAKQTAHLITSDKGSAYVDSTGQPVRLVLPGAVMERLK